MKVAYVLGEFPSLSETFILREMLELGRRGFALSVFALGRPPAGPVHDEARALLAAVRYRPGFLSGESLAALAFFLVRHPGRLARAVGQTVVAGVVHPVELLRCLRHVPTAAAFALAARRAGVTRVHAQFASLPADVARMMGTLMGCGFSLSAHAADIHLQPAALLARKVRAARFVAVCTRHGAGVIRRKVGGALTNLYVIPHGVPVGPGDGAVAGGTLIVAVGRLQAKKGFGTLVEACRLLRERGVAFRCVIAGEGPERRRLEAAIARGSLAGLVTLAGAVTQARVRALLREARVFALPCTVGPDGDCDGLPNALLEAMVAGVPVVSTPVGGIPEAVEDGRTGLLAPPDEAGALADRLEELLKNDGLCRTLGLSGRARVIECYDLARNVAPLAELFYHDTIVWQEGAGGGADHQCVLAAGAVQRASPEAGDRVPVRDRC